MKQLSFITGPSKKFVDKNGTKLVNIFFWLLIISFVLDRIINYFVHFPFFVGCAILLFPFLFLITSYQNPEKWKLNLLVFSFLIITTLNSIFNLFGVKNISDMLFIILFFTIYFYYKHNINSLRISNVYLFLIVSLFLFSFTFINIDSGSINVTKYSSTFNWITTYDEKPGEASGKKSPVHLDKKSPQQSNKKQINSSNKKTKEKEIAVNKQEKLRYKKSPFNKLEVHRIYHNGLFRIPHVASYFFGFLFLFFAYQYQKKKKPFFIILLALSLVLCIYTGSRGILVAFLLSTILLLFNRKYIVYLFLLFVAF